MSNKSSVLSIEMYHRLYRLIKRKIDPRSIAATLNLPLKTVTNVISRIEQTGNQKDQPEVTVETPEFLDIYFIPKIRYGLIQLVGNLIAPKLEQVQIELEKVANAPWKAVALQLTDVQSIDSEASAMLMSFNQRFAKIGRFFAILDPSPYIEDDLKDLGIDGSIPIFGTERAFEDAAFSKKSVFNKR